LLHEAAEKGWSVVAYKKYYPNQDNFLELLSSINSASPDVLFITGRFESDIQIILSNIKELQMKPKAIIGITGAFNNYNFYYQRNLPSDYIVTAAQWHPAVPWKDEKGYSAAQFASDFSHRYGMNPGARSVQAYVAIKVASDGFNFCSTTFRHGFSTSHRQALIKMDKPTI
jgi:ABC-type branched-subunit amino acid transport system substrate-binding protein